MEIEPNNNSEYWHERYIKMSMKVTELSSKISNIKRLLKEIRDKPDMWKAGRISGADQYQGLPPFLRIIDQIINQE